jgi:hypothetical protein
VTTTATVETITPAKAEAYLAMSDGNRPIRPGRVRQYAADMKTGKWLLSGEPIIFNGTALINGHHRLRACVASSTPFESVVVRGVASQAYDVIDSGLARTMGDVLAQHDIGNANLTAAAARLYLSYQAGVINDPQQVAILIGRQRIADHVVNNTELYKWALARHHASKAMKLNASAMVAFRLIIGQNDDRLEPFCEGVLTGANLEVGDPRLTTRTWAMNCKVRTASYHLSGIIRGWNAYAAGAQLNQIKPWFSGSPFPVAMTADPVFPRPKDA